MMAQTKLQRYLFDLSKIPPKERERYISILDGLSYTGVDMADRRGYYAGMFKADNITRIPSNLTAYPFPPGRRIDEILSFHNPDENR